MAFGKAMPVKRSELKRKTAMDRGASALKTFEKEWGLKRTELKRSAPKKRRAKINRHKRQTVLRRQEHRCLVCLRWVNPFLGTGQWAEMHHVLPQSKWPEHALNTKNLVAVCPGCHDNHERAHRRIRWHELPEQVRTWAYTLGGRETLYVEKTYPRT